MTDEASPGEAIDQDRYALVTEKAREATAPDLPYRPRDPRAYRPGIGLIGAGGIIHPAHNGAALQPGHATIDRRGVVVVVNQRFVQPLPGPRTFVRGNLKKVEGRSFCG